VAAVYTDQLRTLRETQARLRALIDNEPECVKLLDREGRVLEMNAAGLRMIEADSAEQVLGHCVYGLVAPAHTGAFRALTERVCGGERGTLEFEMIGLKGARRWLETHAVPFRDEASGATRLLAITRDVTDRRAAELALRESEKRFQVFLDHLPATAWIRDRDFRYTYINRRYSETWGVEGKSIIGRKATELFPAAVAESFRETDERVAREGVPLEYIDGMPSGRWLKMKFPVPDGRGGLGVAGIALDITERSRLEAALRESEHRFRLFMEHAPAAAWIKDAHFRYSYVNRTYESVYGRAAAEVVGRDDFELHGDARARVFREEDERIRASGQAEQKMHGVPYADGRPGHWLVVKFPLEGGVGGIGIDVTPRLEAEEKARRYAEEVRDLANRLVQAQEAERRRIADGLHDLIGQNLTALGIDLQALKQRLQSGGDLVSGPRIDAMAALVDTTIDAIRDVMTDLRPAALEEFGLVPALRWYASQFGKRTGMKIVVRCEGSARRLPADRELALFRIVQEALTNAGKHSGGNAVEVSIAYAQGVQLTVSDNGRGFPEREGARAARRGGFGLPTMRERAKALGGELRVEFPQRGARVVVEVP
jgi:PAS domain S-box-containing protein